MRQEDNKGRPKSGKTGERSERDGSKDEKRPYVAKGKRYIRKEDVKKRPKGQKQDSGDLMRINRFLAHAGVGSRREMDDLIRAGLVTVNGNVMTDLAYRVQPNDEVKFDGKLLSSDAKRYVLLNKPKGFITSMSGKDVKKPVMELVAKACKEAIAPVGNLDRGSTGLMLFTNDEDLSKKLSHDVNGAASIYEVMLDKPLENADMKSIASGVNLEDGKIHIPITEISYVDGKAKNLVGIKLSSGLNRVVRRIFSQFGYEVIKMDRVFYAGLTKKNLPRGHYRFLTKKELDYLRMQGK